MVDYLIRSPRQATTVYGLDGNSAPRKKSLFYVRFKRAGGLAATSDWQTNLGFMVKSIDRPSVQPQIEELNQYNKKRQITTGYKLQPLRMNLYDTADSLVMRMWNEYSRWYFGDFNQDDASSWQYDITTPEFADNGSGFGFQPRPGSGDIDPLDLNSQFFFDLIEVYQVFGGEYTQFDLVNPKITAFDPDDLDYTITEPASINMTIAYEAILYRNNGEPASISTNSDLAHVFAREFNGDTFDVSGAARRPNAQTNTPNVNVMRPTDYRRTTLATIVGALAGNSGNTVGGGALNQFGAYDFGSLSYGTSLGGGTARDVSYQATGNNTLASLLNLPTGSPVVRSVEQIALGTLSTSPQTVSAARLDITQGTLRGAGSLGNPYATSYIDNNFVGGVAASAVLSDNSADDQIASGSGLTLNSQSMGVINAQRPSYSQIGFNGGTTLV